MVAEKLFGLMSLFLKRTFFSRLLKRTCAVIVSRNEKNHLSFEHLYAYVGLEFATYTMRLSRINDWLLAQDHARGKQQF